MKDRFTYIDFLMYVLPGSFLIFVIMGAVWVFVGLTTTVFVSGIFESVIFIVLSFIVGNFIQVVSHLGPEERLKREYWKGYYPSQFMFFKNNPVIDEHARKDLLEACLKNGWLSKEEIDEFNLEKKVSVEAISKATNLFSYLRVHLEKGDVNHRIRGAEGYYLFYRGMFVASIWAAIILLIPVILFLLDKLVFALFSLDLSTISLGRSMLSASWAAVCFVFWRKFRWRARGAAQGFAREVVRAVCSEFKFTERGKSDE